MGTWTTHELTLALDNGYEILDLIEVWDWGNRTSNLLFRDYMMKWMELKLKSSSCPDDVSVMDHVDLLNAEYGLQLKPEDISSNPAMRSLGKLGLNSFWVKII